jgi:hypothetical protein
MAREYLMAITESAFKDPVDIVATEVNDNWLAIQLSGDNSFTGINRPDIEPLNTALARGRTERDIGVTSRCPFQLTTLLYPEQAALLLGWALTPIVKGTPDDPWETTEPAKDLASMSLIHGYEDHSATMLEVHYAGAKVSSFSLSAASGTRGGAFVLTIQGVAATATVATGTAIEGEPATTLYTSAAPYNLVDVSGQLTVNSVAISNFNSLAVEVTNELIVEMNESATPQLMRMRGRDSMMTVGALLKHTPDWQVLYTGRTTFAVQAHLDHSNATDRITLDLPAGSRLDNWDRSTPLRSTHRQEARFVGHYSKSLGYEFLATVTTQP